MTTDCDCEEGLCHWAYNGIVGICPECATVYLRSIKRERRTTQAYAVCTYLAECRVYERWHIGGEA